jgi:ribosomal protein S27E
MNKDWSIYKSKKSWENDGELGESYYPIKSDFDIVCKKCGSRAIIYCEYDFTYGIQNVIKCSKCENEISLYGVDG